MGDERLLLLNLRAIHRRHLFEAARSMVEEEHYGPAIVVAQAAVEVALETAIAFALQVRDIPNPVQVWIGHRSTIDSWSPVNDRVRRLWKALTGDTIGDAPSWATYTRGLRDRHLFTHRAAPVRREQAVRFFDAAEQIVVHVHGVIGGMAEQFP